MRSLLPSALLLAACPAPAGDTGDTTTDASDASTAATVDVPTGGASTADPPTDTTDTATTGDPPSDDDHAFFVPGRMGDEAFILRVSPSTGTIEPFGPALPVAADELAYPVVVARPDRSLVTIQCYFDAEGPMATLLVGDGATWDIVTKYNKFGLGGNAMAADASLFWFDEVTDPDVMLTFQAIVITPTGDPVFTGMPLTSDQRIDTFDFGPDGAYFVYRDAASNRFVRTAAGIEAALPDPYLHLTFATSIVVSDGTTLQWVDLAAQPIAVPGFVASPDNVAHGSGYQILDDDLAILGDRAVMPIQKVPAGMRPEHVYRHVDGFALGRPAQGAKFSTIGAAGEVVAAFTFMPSPNLPDFGEVVTGVLPLADCADCPTRTVVLSVANDIVEGDTSYPADSSIQLWRLDAAGAATGHSLLRPWDEYTWGPRDFHYAADGSALAWTEEGQVLRLDVATAEVATLASPYTLIGP